MYAWDASGMKGADVDNTSLKGLAADRARWRMP